MTKTSKRRRRGVEAEKEREKKGEAEPQEISKSEIFFDETWNKCVKKLRWPIIIVSLAWAGVSFYFASTFEPPEEQAPFLVENNPLQKLLDSLTEEFAKGADTYENV